MKLLLDCPWCEAPLDLPGRDLPDQTQCGECGTRLDLAAEPPAVRTLRRAEPLPDAA